MATSLTGFSLIESIPNNSNGNGWETGHKWTMSRNSSRIFVNEEKEMNETYWISVSDMYFLLPFFMPFMVKPLTRFMDLCGSEGAILDCTLVFNETNRTFETNDVYQSTRFVCQSVCMSVCMCVCVWVSACVLVCVCVCLVHEILVINEPGATSGLFIKGYWRHYGECGHRRFSKPPFPIGGSI